MKNVQQTRMRRKRVLVCIALANCAWAALTAQAENSAKETLPPVSRGVRAASTGIIELRDTPGIKETAYAPEGSPAPSKDPRDLQGTWLNLYFVVKPFTTVDGRFPPYNAAGQNIFWHRYNMTSNGTPVAEPGVLCRPAGALRNMNAGYPFEIVMGKDKIVLMQEEGHSVRIIWMDQQHPKYIEPSYNGHSIGHWEGDTLVVETRGFNGKISVDYPGSPSSTKLQVTERIRKVDLGGPYADLQALITIDDPEYYTAPWTILKTYRWRPDEHVGEYNCEENNRPENSQGIQIENPALLTGR